MKKTGHLALCLLYAAQRLRFSSLLELRPPTPESEALKLLFPKAEWKRGQWCVWWLTRRRHLGDSRALCDITKGLPSHLQCVFYGIRQYRCWKTSAKSILYYVWPFRRRSTGLHPIPCEASACFQSRPVRLAYSSLKHRCSVGCGENPKPARWQLTWRWSPCLLICLLSSHNPFFCFNFFLLINFSLLASPSLSRTYFGSVWNYGSMSMTCCCLFTLLSHSPSDRPCTSSPLMRRGGTVAWMF